MHFVGCAVLPDVPAFNVVIIKYDSREIIFLLELNCLVTYAVGLRERGHEIRWKFESNLNSVPRLRGWEVLDRSGEVVPQQKEMLGGTS